MNWISNNVSLTSPRLLNSLKNSGARTYLEIGSHDFIVPWVDQFLYAKKLDQWGIPHELRVNYLAGHWRDEEGLKALLEDAMTKISTHQYSMVFEHGKKSYYLVQRPLNSAVKMSGPTFTLEAPRYMMPSIGGSLIATGIPGTKVYIRGTVNSLSTFELSGTLDSTGLWREGLGGIESGVYNVDLIQIQQPNEGWETLSSYRGTTSLTAQGLVVEMLSQDQVGSSSYLASSLLKSYLGQNNEYANGPFIHVSYGIAK